MLECYTISDRTARKPYICDLCGEFISKGEAYIRYSGKNSGEFFDLKYHQDCNRLISIFCITEGEDEYDEDQISNWLSQKVCRSECTEEERDDCEMNVFQCTKVLQSLTPQKEGGTL